MLGSLPCNGSFAYLAELVVRLARHSSVTTAHRCALQKRMQRRNLKDATSKPCRLLHHHTPADSRWTPAGWTLVPAQSRRPWGPGPGARPLRARAMSPSTRARAAWRRGKVTGARSHFPPVRRAALRWSTDGQRARAAGAPGLRTVAQRVTAPGAPCLTLALGVRAPVRSSVGIAVWRLHTRRGRRCKLPATDGPQAETPAGAGCGSTYEPGSNATAATVARGSRSCLASTQAPLWANVR